MTDPEQYRQTVQEFLGTEATGLLLTTVPEGSGLCHIANVPIQDYDPYFLSRNPGRWNNAGEVSKYFASNFNTASLESHYPTGTPIEDRIFELHRTTNSFDALEISKSSVPTAVFEPLFEDKSSGSKWDLPNIFMKEIKKHPNFSDIQAVYAASASGLHHDVNGMCFVTSPLVGYTELVATGTSEGWQFGDINYLQS